MTFPRRSAVNAASRQIDLDGRPTKKSARVTTPSVARIPNVADDPPNKRLKLLSFGQPATLVVGEGNEQRTFQVDKDFICATSKFFKTAFAGERWTESRDKLVALPEQGADAVQGYLNWCADKSIDLVEMADVLVDGRPKVHGEWSGTWQNVRKLSTLHDFWMLGDYIDDAKFMNAVMKALIWMHDGLNEGCVVLICSARPTASRSLKHVVNLIMAAGDEPIEPIEPGEPYSFEDISFHKVTAGSALWRWTVDYVAAKVATNDLDAIAKSWSHEFMLAVLRRVSEPGFVKNRLPRAYNLHLYAVDEDI